MRGWRSRQPMRPNTAATATQIAMPESRSVGMVTLSGRHGRRIKVAPARVKSIAVGRVACDGESRMVQCIDQRPRQLVVGAHALLGCAAVADPPSDST